MGHTRTMVFARPVIVSQSEWETSLAAITEREKTVAEAIDQLAAARKRMPMVRVEHDYRFDGPDGERSLAELFDGRSQLILYRFFFEDGVDGWPEAGCPGCSSWADGIGQLGLLHARDITFAMASPAPQENLRRYAERMGWTHIPWYTIRTERFSADFGTEEWFGLNVFLRDGDDVYRTYFLQHGAMVRTIGSVATLISLTPYGGQVDDEDTPEGWPKAPGTFWYRRHDEFDEPAPFGAVSELGRRSVAHEDFVAGRRLAGCSKRCWRRAGGSDAGPKCAARRQVAVGKALTGSRLPPAASARP